MAGFLLSLRGEKDTAGVRSVNCGMAECAGLVFLGLVMEGWSGRGACIRVQRMATHAQQIHLILLQHALIGGTVRGMACLATLDLRLMLINERALLVGMALVADLVLACDSAQLVAFKSTMGIVAVAALHQPFIYTMVKRTCELCAHIHVTAVAKLRRR